jgi:thymidylate kinase
MKDRGMIGHAGERSRGCKNFLSTLFRALDSSKVRYCVLHSWEELPEKLSSDLDIAVHPGDVRKLPFVFRAVREKGYTPLQVFNYFVSAYYFVFFWLEGPVLSSVAVDVILEHRRGGLTVPSGEALVFGRCRQGIFWTPAPESEFTYLLAKKAWKRKVPARQACRLRTLVEQLGRPKAIRLAGELFVGKLKNRVVEACASGSIDVLLAQIRAQTWKTSLLRNPFRSTAYLVSDAMRRVRRWLQPTGLFVIVMGPDGVGKSTLIEHLIQTVGPAFRRHRVFHWRPMLLRRRTTGSDSTRPHTYPAHGGLLSVARLFVHLLDYWIGYWLVIRPLLARSGFVVFDRYFDDVLIDPKRYRYGGPFWLARNLRLLIPKPDLVLVLDAPSEVVLSRKQEVTVEEAQRQRRLYSEYQNETSNSRFIDANASIAQVTSESARAILECLAWRFERRHASWILQSQN